MDRELLRRELVRDEGLRLRMYPDTATPPRWTIGIGHNLTDRGISLAIADALYREDVETHWTELQRLAPWVTELNEVRQRVLMNLAFNLGVSRLAQFRKMLAAVHAGDYQQAAVQMLNSKWAMQVGARATRLAERMRTGIDPT